MSTNILYSTADVVRLTGASYRQIDYWERVGLVKSTREAQGSGSRRGWVFDDLMRVMVVARLLKGGISVQKIRKVMEWKFEWPMIVSDGDMVLNCTKKEAADILVSGLAHFALNVGKVREDLAEVVGR